MTDPNTCSICHERFRLPEFAERCEAQGVPPKAYLVGDVLRRERVPPLIVVRRIDVHHGTTAKCPIDGPCEHAVTYNGYFLWPDRWKKSRSWMAGAGSVVTWDNDHRVRSGHTRVGRLTMEWGVIPDDGEPSDYMTGPELREDWERLWELYPQWSGRWSRRKMMRPLI